MNDFQRFTLTKKWWQSSAYVVTDHTGGFVAKVQKIGTMLSPNFQLGGDHHSIYTFRKMNWFSHSEYVAYQEDELIATFSLNWTFSKVTIVDHRIKERWVLKSIGWGKKLILYKEESEIGFASTPSMNYNTVGLAIKQGHDPYLFVLAVVIRQLIRAAQGG